MIKKFPEEINFKYPWRNYQKRVLDELKEHLSDNHLHVIAPPGSGKTVLGLEVMLRLNKPTLILAPTIAIRNQWVSRFCELFLQIDKVPEWISSNIRKPAFITVSTYQGLHSACTDRIIMEDLENEEEETEEREVEEEFSGRALKEIIQSFKEVSLGTIVVDEAHHLKNAWWETLIQLKKQLDTTVVGLTATPPYDVSFREWSRYIELNGPVDTEISVPELVKEGDLCPHQDYVMFSQPTSNEMSLINEHRNGLKKVFTQLVNDNTLLKQISGTELVLNPEKHQDWIYANMEAYSAILIFLNHHKIILGNEHFEITGNKQKNLPVLSIEWFQPLLSFYLKEFEPTDKETIIYQEEISKLVRKEGVMEKGKINFVGDSKIEKFLTESIGKFESINRITEFELKAMGNQLRQVVLCDYIRKEFLSKTETLNKLGVVPVFESLRRKFGSSIQFGVLSGSLIIIPSTAQSRLEEIASNYSVKSLTLKPLTYDADYLTVTVPESLKSNIVKVITLLFEEGEINVLVGTKSLLGEGWDAPCINSLILASFIGSFVLSNQMRGRAIRTYQSVPDKTSNIWHLVCHDPTAAKGGKDLEILEKRFKGFIGISEKENHTIENGLRRLLIPENMEESAFEKFNQKMLKSASERKILANQWDTAIKKGINLVEEIKIPHQGKRGFKEQKEFYLKKTITYLVLELLIGILTFMVEFIEGIGFDVLTESESFKLFFIVFLVVFFLFFGRKLFRYLMIYIKYRDISKDLKNIAEALVKSLVDVGKIKTKRTNISLYVTSNKYGETFCHIEGCTTFEKNTFVAALEEITAPVDNPRYLMKRKSRFLKFLQQTDYHAVPEVIGRKKFMAQKFSFYWEKHVGDCELIFVRNSKGRASLIKARFHALATQLEAKPERINRWK